jgi:hypothetical protein
MIKEGVGHDQCSFSGQPADPFMTPLLACDRHGLGADKIDQPDEARRIFI